MARKQNIRREVDEGRRHFLKLLGLGAAVAVGGYAANQIFPFFPELKQRDEVTISELLENPGR